MPLMRESDIACCALDQAVSLHGCAAVCGVFPDPPPCGVPSSSCPLCSDCLTLRLSAPLPQVKSGEAELEANREELQGSRAQLAALLDRQDEVTNTCVICYDAAPNIALVPCGHMCMCSECTLSLQLACGAMAPPRMMSREEARRWRLEHSPKCPVCRQIFSDTLRIYT